MKTIEELRIEVQSANEKIANIKERMNAAINEIIETFQTYHYCFNGEINGKYFKCGVIIQKLPNRDPYISKISKIFSDESFTMSEKKQIKKTIEESAKKQSQYIVKRRKSYDI